MKHTKEELSVMQALPLDVKIRMTETRIRQWVNAFGEDGVYISFSGGKDSTVLMDIARRLYPELPAVFVNTGLEYPEVVQFVKTFDNVEILRPKKSFKQVVTECGYPFVGKDVAKSIFYARKGGRESWAYKKLNGLERFEGSIYAAPKYGQLVDADYIVGAGCCSAMKKGPAHAYNRKTKRRPITAMLAEESQMRMTQWFRNGCNAFDTREPISHPMAFWTDNDVLEYIKTRDLSIASVYGDVVVTDPDGMEYAGVIGGPCKYQTTLRPDRLYLLRLRRPPR